VVTRLVFIVVALAIAGSAVWAYRHDAELATRARAVEVGDPNETVREMLGDPSSEGSCGSVSVAPSGCADEYVYRYYYAIFQPQYEVVWFNAEGKAIGRQHVQRAF
jgi:hypothetical protein